MKTQYLARLVGTAALALGMGILISFFLPDAVLAVIEAILIVAVGALFFIKPRC
jgi:hypothetical protein